MTRKDNWRTRLEPGLDDRLSAWGWAMRPELKAGTSPTYEICRRLEILAGVVEVKPSAGMKQSDLDAATEVERAWSFLVAPVNEKKMLAEFYIMQMPMTVLCRRHRVPFRELDNILYRTAVAVEEKRKALAGAENIPDNRAYNLITG